MKHLFVPYQLAKLAKEKGFGDECFGYYRGDKLSYCVDGVFPIDNAGVVCAGFQDMVAAPLYQQLVDWFRDEHEIKVIESPSGGYKIWTKYDGKWFSDTWRDTRDAALSKAFELTKSPNHFQENP